MWSHDGRRAALAPDGQPRRTGVGRYARLAAALLIAGAAAGCFQPLYGERSLVDGGPGLRTALAGVQIATIDAPAGTALARLAIETRNELSFHLTGGAAPLPPSHRLIISLSTGGSSLIV